MVVDGSELEVGLALAIGALYLAYDVVIVPCGSLVEFIPVRPEEVDTLVGHHSFGVHRPPDSLHLGLHPCLRLAFLTLFLPSLVDDGLGVVFNLVEA